MKTFTKIDGGTVFTSKAYDKDGIWHWASNDAPCPLDAAKEYGIPVDPVKQRAALDAHYDKVIANYRRQQASLTAEELAEQRAEARAAHGPGVKLVDVLTGKTFTT